MNQFDMQHFLDSYTAFDENTWSKLRRLYHVDAQFIDPIHAITGHAAIEQYFKQMSEGLLECTFELGKPVTNPDKAVVAWTMIYRHQRIHGGRPIAVEGITQLDIADGVITCHRDYYDLGQMVYEQMPVLGRLIAWLRRRMAKLGTETTAGESTAITGGLARGKQ